MLVIGISISLSACALRKKTVNTPTHETTAETYREEEVTHSETEPAVEDTIFNIKLSFAGDMLLAAFKDETKPGNFNDCAAKNPPSYFLEKVRHIFEADDFSIANLENVFTDKDLEPVPKDHDPAYWYKSKTSNVEILTSCGIDGVSLVNNHTNDYGDDGYNDTLQTVKDAELFYGTENEIMYLEKNGFTIAVVCTGLWNGYQARYVNTRLDTAKENSDYQVVFFHGGTELIHEPEEWKITACHELVDNGADLVIGGHPHVLQPREIYNGVEIIYSMGNFCFGDAYRPENRTIIYQMDLTVDKDTLTVSNAVSEMIPCYLYTGDRSNYQPAVIEDETEKNKVISFMNMECDSPV